MWKVEGQLIYTNKSNLPAAFALAVKGDTYSPGSSDITVTGLLSPPRARAIINQHHEEITEDVEDRVWALLGTAVHVVLERAGAGAGDRVEERLYTTINGWKVGGKYDSCRLLESSLSDYKVTSVFTRIFGSRMKEWTEQLNMLAALCRINEIEPIENLSIVALYRDWAASKVDGHNYPPAAVEEIPIECMTQSDAVDMMTGLVLKHQEAEIKLPECTPEERWFNKRTGKNQRCERYCQASPFCEQWKAIQSEKS